MLYKLLLLGGADVSRLPAPMQEKYLKMQTSIYKETIHSILKKGWALKLAFPTELFLKIIIDGLKLMGLKETIYYPLDNKYSQYPVQTIVNAALSKFWETPIKEISLLVLRKFRHAIELHQVATLK